MNYKMSDIEGVGDVYAEKLAEAGVRSTGQFLNRGATPKGRAALQEATGVSAKLILRWCNQADLMRVSGIGTQFAELLEAAGVDTVKELGKRNADNLTARMESFCRAGEILASQETLSNSARKVKHSYQFEINPKGMVERLRVCNIIGLE